MSRYNKKHIQMFKKMSVRESEIIELVKEEKTYSEIASIIFLSERTIENHCYRIRNSSSDLNAQESPSDQFCEDMFENCQDNNPYHDVWMQYEHIIWNMACVEDYEYCMAYPVD